MSLCPIKCFHIWYLCSRLLHQNTNLATVTVTTSDNCHYSLTCDSREHNRLIICKQLQFLPLPPTEGAILRNSLALLALQFATCHVVIVPLSFQHNLLLPKWCVGVWHLCHTHEHFAVSRLHFLQQLLLYSLYYTRRYWMPLTSTYLPMTFSVFNPFSIPFHSNSVVICSALDKDTLKSIHLGQ